MRTRTAALLSPAPRSLPLQLAIAAIVVGAAFLVPASLNAWVETQYFFGVFYVAVALSAWLGRLVCGLAAMLLAAAASWYLIISHGSSGPSAAVEWSIFLAGATLICLLFDSRDRALSSAQEAHAILKSLVEAVPLGIALLDRNMRYQMVNEALSRINGIPVSAHLGKTVDELLPRFTAEARERFKRALDSGDGPFFCEFEADSPAQPGNRKLWRQCWFSVRIREERPTYVGAVIEDVTAQRQIDKALADSSRRKEEALSVIGHELRDPLSAATASYQYLSMTGKLPDQDRPLKIIGRQLGFMRRLLDDVLDMSRLNTGKVTLSRRLVDVRSIIQETVEAATPLTEGKNQRIEVLLPATAVNGSVDASRVRQILANLLSNACKFSPEGGRVEVSLWTEPAGICISVRDWGEGLTQEAMSRIFRKWEQIGERNRSGLGLGLALAKALTELHGGDLSVSSDGPGQGSRFTVFLPEN